MRARPSRTPRRRASRAPRRGSWRRRSRGPPSPSAAQGRPPAAGRARRDRAWPWTSSSGRTPRYAGILPLMLMATPGPGIRETPHRSVGLARRLGGNTLMTRARAGAKVGLMNTTTSSTAPPDDFIRSFSNLGRADVAYAGGKGANLGELTRAGLPVPPGFVVGAPAYATFCDESGLRAQLEKTLADIDIEDGAALEAAATAARQAALDAPMPPELRDAIVAAYLDLAGAHPDAPVAVRSSATAEDTASASFAGMNETFLNTRGPDAVLDAVKRCWGSLFGARTIYYRGQRGFSQAGMDIAVVVQVQIPSTRAGVMFTVDPASGDPDMLVIEAAEGGGTRTRTLSSEEGMRPVLSDLEVIDLAKLGLAIEQHYGSGQDTEWSFDPDGNAWMLQSRPITTIAAPEHAPDEVLVRGLGAAPGLASGKVRIL